MTSPDPAERGHAYSVIVDRTDAVTGYTTLRGAMGSDGLSLRTDRADRVISTTITASGHVERGFGGLIALHEPPTPWCYCGVNVETAIENRIRGGNVAMLIAEVAAYGRICGNGPQSIRAQYAEIRSLAMLDAPSHTTFGDIPPEDHPPIARAAAQQLNVPLVALEEPDEQRKRCPELAAIANRISTTACSFPPNRVFADPGDHLLPGDVKAGFRFRFGGQHGYVRIAGFTPAKLKHRPRQDEPHAFGDIIRRDDDVAIARFEGVARSYRDQACYWLEQWAEADDWQLEVMPGLFDTAPSDHPHSRTLFCNRCADQSHVAVVALGALQTKYKKTRCYVCGQGRRMPVDHTEIESMRVALGLPAHRTAADQP